MTFSRLRAPTDFAVEEGVVLHADVVEINGTARFALVQHITRISQSASVSQATVTIAMLKGPVTFEGNGMTVNIDACADGAEITVKGSIAYNTKCMARVFVDEQGTLNVLQQSRVASEAIFTLTGEDAMVWTENAAMHMAKLDAVLLGVEGTSLSFERGEDVSVVVVGDNCGVDQNHGKQQSSREIVAFVAGGRCNSLATAHTDSQSCLSTAQRQAV